MISSPAGRIRRGWSDTRCAYGQSLIRIRAKRDSRCGRNLRRGRIVEFDIELNTVFVKGKVADLRCVIACIALRGVLNMIQHEGSAAEAGSC